MTTWDSLRKPALGPDEFITIVTDPKLTPWREIKPAIRWKVPETRKP